MPTASRPSIVLLLVLAIALASGAAASLLIGAATPSGYTSSPAPLIVLPSSFFADLLLAVGVAILCGLVYQRLSGPTAPVPRRNVITVLFVVLFAILFIAAAHTFLAGGPEPNGKVLSTPVSNSTNSGGGNSSGSSPAAGPGGVLWSPSIPSWVPFLIIAGVAIAAVAIGLPQARAYLDERRQRSAGRDAAPAEAPDVRSALERANRSLADGGDPRAAILELYESVLERLTSMVGSVELDTPEEIRTTHLLRLGIRPEPAEALTRLFEEARYSSHPLSPGAVDRARAAVREALADLARSPAPV